MEKQASIKLQPPPPPPPQQHQLSPQEWETLIDDFSSGDPLRRSRHLHLPLLDLALTSLLRRDLPASLKSHLLLFLEDSLPPSSPVIDSSPVFVALRQLIVSSSDPQSLKDHAMVTATSLAVAAPAANSDLSALAETLLAVANRPNHSPDRISRSLACECLKELESANPGLLSELAGHIWTLAHAERTHVAQSYVLLLASVVKNIVRLGLLSSPIAILSTSAPLVPFNVPSLTPPVDPEPSDLNVREVRRVMSFLLERPQGLTPFATMELVSMLTDIAGALEKHVPAIAALLKVQFSGLIYSCDPVLCHVVLTLCSRFSDAFSREEELGIARRLALVPREAHQPLVFRLLSLHWLMGFNGKASIGGLIPCFYPTVFDPLALKAKKLDVLSWLAVRGDDLGVEGGKREESGGALVVKLFEDGLTCLSSFKWLPPWSTETSMAFRTFHKFLIGVTPLYGDRSEYPLIGALEDSTILCTLENMLVKLALEHRGLVPVIAIFVDQLLQCKTHRWVGERLLQKFDEHLLPKLKSGYRLASYFPIFERIALSETVPPRGLLELLTGYMVSLVEKHGPDMESRSWSEGTKALGICRLMLLHHHSSRVFLPLSHLLSFTCQSFPDLEVRDKARIYLRMLVCIPGKKLRHILKLGEQIPGVSPSPHAGGFLQVPSPRPSRDLKNSAGVASYIFLERLIPLLVKQSWSLTLPNMGSENDEASYFAGIGDISTTPSAEPERESEVSIERITSPREPLRVMDSKVAGILGILRRHFACIPDYRHIPGIKIRIPCVLRFESEPFTRVWGADLSSSGSDDVDNLAALYATVITFSSAAKYGSIPHCRVPFLLGEPLKTGPDVVSVVNEYEGDSSFQALVMIELEPQEPMPGLIDVTIKANAENGQVISGSLESITVGIEDMFHKATLPADIMEERVPGYYLDLFHALWEACGNSANTGRETFPLDGGKGAAAICGTRSVKLLEVSSDSLIDAVQQHMAPFVVSIIGDPLVNAVKDKGVIRDVVWELDSENFSAGDVDALVPYTETAPLQLPYVQDVSNEVNFPEITKRNMGIFLVLIFLPPRFHLLFQMEIGHVSTLVRIRTDHWPCLAYVDDYLESLSSI